MLRPFAVSNQKGTVTCQMYVARVSQGQDGFVQAQGWRETSLPSVRVRLGLATWPLLMNETGEYGRLVNHQTVSVSTRWI